MENEYPIPCNLNECFSVLDLIMSESSTEDQKWFKKTDTKIVVAELHFNLGRWIRNSWGLWDKNSKLFQYLNSLDIWHADDMYSFIMTSYHRHTNKEELKLQEQVQVFKEYWKTYEKNNGPITK